MKSSVFESTTAADVLRAAGKPTPANAKQLVRCHFHDDRSPSLRIFDHGFVCFGCGARGGVADLVIALGLASDRRSAARWIEENVR